MGLLFRFWSLLSFVNTAYSPSAFRSSRSLGAGEIIRNFFLTPPSHLTPEISSFEDESCQQNFLHLHSNCLDYYYRCQGRRLQRQSSQWRMLKWVLLLVSNLKNPCNIRGSTGSWFHCCRNSGVIKFPASHPDQPKEFQQCVRNWAACHRHFPGYKKSQGCCTIL